MKHIFFRFILLTGFVFHWGNATFGQNFPADGIYFSFESFKTASPGLVRNELYGIDDQDSYSIRRWFNTEKLYRVTGTGLKVEVSMDSLWGYVEKGNAYIYMGERFHKITTIGSICYFLESYPTIQASPAPVITEVKGFTTYRLLDMQTGELLYYTPEDLLSLLERDEQLAKEYRSLNNVKVQRKKMYQFVEKYNKAHPLNSTN